MKSYAVSTVYDTTSNGFDCNTQELSRMERIDIDTTTKIQSVKCWQNIRSSVFHNCYYGGFPFFFLLSPFAIVTYTLDFLDTKRKYL